MIASRALAPFLVLVQAAGAAQAARICFGTPQHGALQGACRMPARGPKLALYGTGPALAAAREAVEVEQSEGQRHSVAAGTAHSSARTCSKRPRPAAPISSSWVGEREGHWPACQRESYDRGNGVLPDTSVTVD